MSAFKMKKMMIAASLFASAFAHADAIDDAVVSGIKAHQAAKCMAYLEIADADGQDAYFKLATVYSDNIGAYIDNVLNEQYKSKFMESTIPMMWYVKVVGNRLDKQMLVGRILEWTTMVETQRAGNVYAPNEPTIPKSAGIAAYNQENCVLLAQ